MHYLFGDYTLDTERYELHRADSRIPLRPKVFQLLVYLWLVELRAARMHLDRGLACWSPQQHFALDLCYVGAAIGVVCRATLAWTLWILGYPEQALTSVHATRVLAQQLSHPVSLVDALDYAVGLHQLRREVQALQGWVEELRTLARAQEFPLWIARGTAVQASALAMQQHSTTSIGQMWEGLADWRATGVEICRP